jgi:8-oxo-dGTP diphosphatase
MNTIRKAALAACENGKVLMVRSHKHPTRFFTLGGKYEGNETDIECLVREVKEEANSRIDLPSLKFLHEFRGPAHGRAEPADLVIRLYFGKLLDAPTTTADTAEVKYFNTSDLEGPHITEMGKQIFLWLKAHNYIS